MHQRCGKRSMQRFGECLRMKDVPGMTTWEFNDARSNHLSQPIRTVGRPSVL
jgi:hypothetical protein